MAKYYCTDYEGAMPFHDGDERTVYIRLISDVPGNRNYKWIPIGKVKNDGGVYTYTQEVLE
jgi:hypothetical protein